SIQHAGGRIVTEPAGAADMSVVDVVGPAGDDPYLMLRGESSRKALPQEPISVEKVTRVGVFEAHAVLSSRIRHDAILQVRQVFHDCREESRTAEMMRRNSRNQR